MNINQILRRTKNKPSFKQLFEIANAAKNAFQREVANYIFGYLFHEAATSIAVNTQIRVQFEYSEAEGCCYLEGLEISNHAISKDYFHALVVLYMGNKENPDHYLCIPAPLLTTRALRWALQAVKTQGGCRPRREHNRRYDFNAPFGHTIESLKEMGIQAPDWVLQPEMPITPPRAVLKNK